MAHVIRVLLSIMMVLLSVTQSGCGGNKKKMKNIKARLEDSNISNKKKLKICEDEVRDVLDKYEKGKKDDEENKLNRQIKALCMGITVEFAVEDVVKNVEDFSKLADFKDAVTKLRKAKVNSDNVLKKETCASFNDRVQELALRIIDMMDKHFEKTWGLVKPIGKMLKKRILNRQQLNENDKEEISAVNEQVMGLLASLEERWDQLEKNFADFDVIFDQCQSEWPTIGEVITNAAKELKDQTKSNTTICKNMLRPCTFPESELGTIFENNILVIEKCSKVWLGKWSEEAWDMFRSFPEMKEFQDLFSTEKHGSHAFKEEHGEHDEKVEGEEAQGQRMQGGVERQAHLKIDS